MEGAGDYVPSRWLWAKSGCLDNILIDVTRLDERLPDSLSTGVGLCTVVLSMRLGVLCNDCHGWLMLEQYRVNK
ncbi:hypothetical protein D3C71_1810940 [compost metagenome]